MKQRGGAWLEALNLRKSSATSCPDYSPTWNARARACKRWGLPDTASTGISGRPSKRPSAAEPASCARSSGPTAALRIRGASASPTERGSGSRDSLLPVPHTPTGPSRGLWFLLSKQRSNGGWGEDGGVLPGAAMDRGSRATGGGAAWALSILCRARHPSAPEQRRAAEFLVERQEHDGSWKREPLVGVFNRTCLINYDNYRHYFPIWALAEYTRAQPAESERDLEHLGAGDLGAGAIALEPHQAGLGQFLGQRREGHEATGRPPSRSAAM